MKRFLLLSTVALFVLPMAAQPYLNWFETYGTTTQEQGAEDVIWTNEGDMLSAGSFEGTVDFGGLEFSRTSNGSSDMYLLKQNDLGLTQWVKSWGGTGIEIGKSIAIDSIGNIFLFGSFSDTLIVETDTLVSRGNRDIVLLKLNSNGDLIWSYHIGSNQEDLGRDVVIDHHGNPHITFQYRDTAHFENQGLADSLVSNGLRDVGVIKLHSNGEVLWAHTIGSEGPSDYAQAIAVDSVGMVYVFGSFRDEVDFNPNSGENYLTAYGTDAFLLKLDSLGGYKWSKIFGQASEDFAVDMFIKGESIYMTGSFKGGFDALHGGGTYILNSNGHYDAYIVKLYVTGFLQWAKSMGDIGYDAGLAIGADSQGNTYTTGLFTGQTDLDPGPDTLLATGLPSRFTMFLQKLNPQGDLIWASEFSGQGDGYMEGIALRDDGVIALTGKFKGNTDIAPYEDEVLMPASTASSNVFTVRFDQCLVSNVSLAITECGAYDWNGTVYDSTGVYTQSLINALGCDSIVELTLTIQEESSSELELSDCDSISVNDVTYFDSGVFEQQLQNAVGCDSILQLNLSIGHSSTFELDSLSCAAIMLNGVSYDETGLYTQTLVNSSGCDSIISLDFTLPIVDTGIITTDDVIEATAIDASYQWVDCNADYVFIDGETSTSFQALMDGNYAVIVTDGLCSDTSDCVVIEVSSIQDYIFSQVSIFPNPSNGNVQLNHLPLHAELRLYDSSSRIVHTSFNTSEQHYLSLENLENGVYYLVIFTESEQGYKTLVIQK